MNIRFSPDSVRVRISLEEALTLERDGTLNQKVPLAEGGLSIELTILSEQRDVAQFTYQGGLARTSLRKSEFLALLADKPSRESCIRASLGSTSDSPLDFVFEIDLLSRKHKRESRS